MLPWLLLLLCSPARATLSNGSLAPHTDGSYPVPTSLRQKRLAISGETVWLSCQVTYSPCMYAGPCPSIENLAWYYSSTPTLGGYHIVQRGQNLSLQTTVESSGQYLCSYEPTETTSSQVITVTVAERLESVQLVATPPYHVVMEGQPVELYCNSSPPLSRLTTTFYWRYIHLDNNYKHLWNNSQKIVITMPEESGRYFCDVESTEMGFFQVSSSGDHLISIVPKLKTAGPLLDYMGVAGFVLSLLVWLTLLAALLCCAKGSYGWNRTALQDTASSSAKANGLTDLKTAKGEGLSSAEGQGDYVNFTRVNLAYVDLEPDPMRAPDIYSTLS